MEMRLPSEVRQEERLAILREADTKSPTKVAEKHGIARRAIYDWRKLYKWPVKKRRSAKARTKSKPRAKVQSAPKRKRSKSRRTYTDAQKRIILRQAKDTTPADAARRNKMGSTSLIYKWRASGLRPARSSASNRKSVATRRTRKANGGHAVPHTSAAEINPSVRAKLIDDAHALQAQLGQALQEAAELREIVIEQTLEIRRLRAQN